MEQEVKDPISPPYKKNNISGRGFFFDILKFAVIALLIVIPIRVYIAQPFVVSGASMQPTFETGDYIIVDQLSYRIGTPARDDIIIFRLPLEQSKFLIKRVIGLPNETVIIQDEKIFIENETGRFALSEPYVSEENVGRDFLTTKLKDGEYFVLGDNRAASFDSRAWGVLPEEFITGRALLRLLPIGGISVFPGAAN